MVEEERCTIDRGLGSLSLLIRTLIAKIKINDFRGNLLCAYVTDFAQAKETFNYIFSGKSFYSCAVVVGKDRGTVVSNRADYTET